MCAIINIHIRFYICSRRVELKFVKGRMFVNSILSAFNFASRIAIFLSLVSYVSVGNTINAKQVFIVTSYFNFLYTTMLHCWPVAITSCAEFYVSVKRIEEFLLSPDGKVKKTLPTNGESKESELLLSSFQSAAENVVRLHTFEDDRPKDIRFENVTAMWTTNDSNTKPVGLRSITLEMTNMCAIVGTVGSGKSTMLQAILGELELDRGTLTMNGKLSYAAQEPWLFEASVRQNILFNEAFNAKRYAEVVRVCALERDLQLLPFGDQTLIGERGVSLSGGQRGRINLARAVYRKADIYLLDDPLSAVDMHVGKHIFEKCIREFLRDKTVVLVTHQLQYLIDESNILLMNGGEISAHGSYDELSKSHGYLLRAAAVATEDENEAIETLENATQTFTAERQSDQFGDENNRRQRAVEEYQRIGSVGLATYWNYLRAVKSAFILIAIGLTLPAEQAVTSYIDYYVSKW